MEYFSERILHMILIKKDPCTFQTLNLVDTEVWAKLVTITLYRTPYTMHTRFLDTSLHNVVCVSYIMDFFDQLKITMSVLLEWFVIAVFGR